MRSRRVAGAGLLAALALSTTAASTASTSVPTSTATYRTVTVTGATARSLSYTTAAGLITGVSPRLRGSLSITTPVRARYGTGPTVTCTAGVLSVVNLLAGLREGTYDCLGFAEPADRPRALVITVG